MRTEKRAYSNGLVREPGRVMRPVDKTPRVRPVTEYEQCILDALSDYGEPVTSSTLAEVLGESPVLVARALGTLRFNRLASVERAGAQNWWSPC